MESGPVVRVILRIQYGIILLKVKLFYLFKTSRYLVNYCNSYINPIQSISTNNKSGLTFLTFANRGYQRPTRVYKQAMESSWFSRIEVANESLFSTFSNLDARTIRKYRFKGYGLWSWKPSLIFKFLDEAEENSILIYADSGIHLNAKAGNDRLHKYIDLFTTTGTECIFFAGSRAGTNPYLEHQLFNEEILKKYGYSFLSPLETPIYAGLMMLKKSPNTLHFLKFWEELCSNPTLIESCRDADNGLLQFAISEKLNYSIVPGEDVNILLEDGRQAIHGLTKSEYENLDWTALSESPFQVRRDRAKRRLFGRIR